MLKIQVFNISSFFVCHNFFSSIFGIILKISLLLSVESRLKCIRCYLFAVSNFEPYIKAYRSLGNVIPAIKPYLPALLSDMKKTEIATKSGNVDLLLEGMADGTKRTEIITPLLKPVPEAYALAKQTPGIAKEFMYEIKHGSRKPADLNDLVAYYLSTIKGGKGKSDDS